MCCVKIGTISSEEWRRMHDEYERAHCEQYKLPPPPVWPKARLGELMDRITRYLCKGVRA